MVCSSAPLPRGSRSPPTCPKGRKTLLWPQGLCAQPLQGLDELVHRIGKVSADAQVTIVRDGRSLIADSRFALRKLAAETASVAAA